MPFEVEHVIPPAHGGADHPANLALACRACNVHKADHIAAKGELGEEHPLFHPRTGSWSAHFRVNDDTGEIVGLTPVGRATVVCLRMNAPLRLEARRLWRQLGLFP